MPSTIRPVVLVVDDDASVRASLGFLLSIEGYTVKSYPDGVELLADANVPTQGCLVIDLNLPRIDGIELLRQLRARRIGLPAILITSHPSTALKERARAAGILAIVEKPFLGTALVDSVRIALADGRDRETPIGAPPT